MTYINTRTAAAQGDRAKHTAEAKEIDCILGADFPVHFSENLTGEVYITTHPKTGVDYRAYNAFQEELDAAYMEGDSAELGRLVMQSLNDGLRKAARDRAKAQGIATDLVELIRGVS